MTGTVIMYHVTYADYKDSILSGGLISGAARGASALFSHESKGHVYLWSKRSTAEHTAQVMSRAFNRDHIVLAVAVPIERIERDYDTLAYNLSRDIDSKSKEFQEQLAERVREANKQSDVEWEASSGAYRVSGSISPEQINVVATYSRGSKVESTATIIEESSKLPIKKMKWI